MKDVGKMRRCEGMRLEDENQGGSKMPRTKDEDRS